MIIKTRRFKNLYAIQTDSLRKIYPGTDYYAINNISIACKEGDIYSFLGENGAGKTTTVKILCTVLLPSAGTAYIKGYSIQKEPEEVRKIIGYLPQKSNVSIFFDWTVWENLKFFCAMNGVTGEEFRRRAEDLLKENDIHQKRNDLFRNLSGGMQQKVALIRSIIHDPEVLFLDEPTAGLDVHSKLQMISFIRDLKKEGRTIFLTTHDMQVAEALSDDIAFIRKGGILRKGSLKEVMGEFSHLEPIEIQCRKEDAEKVCAVIEESGKGDIINWYPVRILTEDAAGTLSLLENYRVTPIRRDISLEDIYLKTYCGDHDD
ncbi:MAG: ABC transporter ATP-binding protein [Candidatus Methanofastidiosia archaeon]